MSRRSSRVALSFFAFQDIITTVVGIFVLITLLMILQISSADSISDGPTGDYQAILDTLAEIKQSNAALEQKLAAARQQAADADKGMAQTIGRSPESLQDELKNALAALSTAQRQLENTQERAKRADQELADLQKETELARREAEGDAAQTQEEIDSIKKKIARIESSSFPIFGSKLGNGKSLCVIRLGDHPKSSTKHSIRDSATASVMEMKSVDEVIAWVRGRNHSGRHFILLVAPGGADDFDRLRPQMKRLSFGFEVIGSEDDLTIDFQLDEAPPTGADGNSTGDPA
ncbi:MAG: OmpH family outer membrane protein [Planctomycetota bacterium]